MDRGYGLQLMEEKCSLYLASYICRTSGINAQHFIGVPMHSKSNNTITFTTCEHRTVIQKMISAQIENFTIQQDNVVFIFNSIVMEQYDISDEQLINNEVPQQEVVVAEAAIKGQSDFSVDSEEEYFLRLCLQPWEDEATENQTGKF